MFYAQSQGVGFNPLQAYHQMLSATAASGYPNMSMYAPQQRMVPGPRSPFMGPMMYPQIPSWLDDTRRPRPRGGQIPPGLNDIRFPRMPRPGMNPRLFLNQFAQLLSR